MSSLKCSIYINIYILYYIIQFAILGWLLNTLHKVMSHRRSSEWVYLRTCIFSCKFLGMRCLICNAFIILWYYTFKNEDDGDYFLSWSEKQSDKNSKITMFLYLLLMLKMFNYYWIWNLDPRPVSLIPVVGNLYSKC